MNDSQIQSTFLTAVKFGGSFYSSLGASGLKADAQNKARLLLAFPELVDKYGPESPFKHHQLNQPTVVAPFCGSQLNFSAPRWN